MCYEVLTALISSCLCGEREQRFQLRKETNWVVAGTSGCDETEGNQVEIVRQILSDVYSSLFSVRIVNLNNISCYTLRRQRPIFSAIMQHNFVKK